MDQEWGDGDPLYLKFIVEDTGRGLTSEEQQRLFSRFAQGSTRTHVKYGGSGLGLFISRELAELQGGEIGFSSTPGIGSTFCFYIKTRRSITDDAIDRKRSTGNAKEQEAIVSRMSM